MPSIAREWAPCRKRIVSPSKPRCIAWARIFHAINDRREHAIERLVVNIARFWSTFMLSCIVACGSSTQKPAGSADDEDGSDASGESGGDTDHSSSDESAEAEAAAPKCD